MTPRSYAQGRTARAPEARLSQDERDRLIMMLDKDSLSMADWIMRHVKEDEEMESKKEEKRVTVQCAKCGKKYTLPKSEWDLYKEEHYSNTDHSQQAYFCTKCS